jgi:hypothetical protein
VPGAHALALLSFSLYLTRRQVYAWLDGAQGDSAAVERPGLRLRARMLARPAKEIDGVHWRTLF